MKLTTQQIKQIIKEELTNILQESLQAQKVFALLGGLDGGWMQGMLIADSLPEQDKQTFMQLVAGFVVDKLKELQKEIDDGHRNRKTGQYFKLQDITSGSSKYQIEFRIFFYDPYFGDEFDESFLRLNREDGMLDIDLHIKPSTDPMDYFYTVKPERYKEEGLELAEALEKIKLAYTQGGAIQ